MSDYTEILINKYVWRQFQLEKPAIYAKYGTTIPFFPINDIKAGDSSWGNKPYVIYDSFIRPRQINRPFYPQKGSQLMYSIRGTIQEVYEWRDFIYDALDREFYFHRFSVNQLKYIATTSTESGLNKSYSTELVIRYDYHKTDI
jgi:hypothetical protein